MSIYTKKGDNGTTKTLRQKRKKISKTDPVIETLGKLDELNSYLGVVKASGQSLDLEEKITSIQTNLLLIGSIIAGAELFFSKQFTIDLEKQIDELEKSLPKLENFIIPGGSLVSAHLQYARALARSLERSAVALSLHIKMQASVLSFLNRLSDYLFVLARYENFKVGIEDNKWVMGTKK